MKINRIRICTKEGKPKYDKKGAKTVCNKRWEEDRVMLRIYPCFDHWHLTHKAVVNKKFKKPAKNQEPYKRERIHKKSIDLD